MLQTPHLRLIPATAELVAQEIADRTAFGLSLDAEIPLNWPPEELADALPFFRDQLSAHPEHIGWLSWYAVRKPEPNTSTTGMLIGSLGFFGPPADGAVEIGYSVLPQFQQRGYATEMATALIAWAFTQPGVDRVVAETKADNTPSLRVLEKAGFLRLGAGRDAGSWQWARESRSGEAPSLS